MKKQKKLFPVLLSVGALTACNGVDSAELEENWAEYVVEGSENLESYSTSIDLGVRAEVSNQIDESQISLQADVIGDFDRGYAVMTIEGQVSELFFDGERVFVRETGSEWQDVSGQSIATETTYQNVLEAVLNIEELLEAEHSDNELAVSYVGNDREVWDTFQAPFSLNIEGFEIEEVTMILDVTFDDEELFMQNFELDIQAAEEQAAVQINILIDYEDHNEIDSFEVEEEIQSQFNL